MSREPITTPTLRFREFAEPWVPVSLASIYPFIRNGFVGVATPFYVNFGVPYLQGKNIKDNAINSDQMVFVSDEFHHKNQKSQLKLNDILMVQSGHVGECAVVTAEYVGSNCHALLVLTPRTNIISTFYVYFFYSPYGRRRIHRIKTGNTIEHILSTDLKELEILCPGRSEQQKIAAFLVEVDKKIAQLKTKRELLLKYKKGVMQQIFDQEIRFKERNGGDFPDWKEFRLNQFLVPTPRQIEKPARQYLAIGVRSHFKGTFQKTDSDPRKIEMNKMYVVRAGDLIVNITFAWEGAVAIAKEEDDDGLVSHRFPTYTFNESVASSEFFQYIYPNTRFKHLLKLISPGGAGRNRVLNKKDFLSLKVSLPTIPEQTKITRFLNALDFKIDCVDAQLRNTRIFKKGLLQQMFV